jgi:hypothetical protein
MKVIALMREAASTSVNFYQTTRHNIPEYSHLYTVHAEKYEFNTHDLLRHEIP